MPAIWNIAPQPCMRGSWVTRMWVALVFVFISIDLYTLPATQEHPHATARHGGEADEDGVGVGEVGHACVIMHVCAPTHMHYDSHTPTQT